MFSLRTPITTGLVALTIASATIATASTADARNRFLPGVGVGLLGGALAATVLSQPHYAGPAYYDPNPVGYAPAYDPQYVVSAPPACHVVWKTDAWGDNYRTRVCY